MIELIKFKRLHPDAILPRRMTAGAIGLDVSAFLLSESGRPNKLMLPPRMTRNVPTGLLIEPPPGHFIIVCSRSGLAMHSVVVANAPGIIDPDYRGELMVLLFNGGIEAQWIEHEQRIAQIVLLPAVHATPTITTELSSSERGTAGFGSTGKGGPKT